MNIAIFSDLPFDDHSAFDDFSLAHGLSHDQIAQNMYANGLYYVTYDTYDTPVNDKDWLQTHQTEHESIFNLLGIPDMPDLSSADLSKEDEFLDWQLQHSQVHTIINSALGIV